MKDSSEADEGPGLRQRMKQHTRDHIVEVALSLFLQHGFDAVTVVQIAAKAGVAQQTVFNYFRTKEDLVYRRLEGFEEELVASLRDRQQGESLPAAFQHFIFERRGLLSDDDSAALDRLVAVNRLIAESPSLQARERLVFDRYTGALARLIAEEHGQRAEDIRAWTMANALVGVHRALVEYVRRQLLLGRRGKSLRSSVTIEANRAFALIREGLDAFEASSDAFRADGERASGRKRNGGEAGIRTLDTGEPV